MIQLKVTIDLAVIEELCTLADLPIGRLERLAGLGHDYLQRRIRGETPGRKPYQNPEVVPYFVVDAIAKILEVPAAVITTAGGEDRWEAVPWFEGEKLKPFLGHMARAKSCIGCVQDMDGYLVSDGMIQSTEERRLRELRWPKEEINRRLTSMLAYVNDQRRQREQSLGVHRIFGRETYFAKHFAIQPGFAPFVGSRLKFFEGTTVLGLVPSDKWGILNNRVRGLLDCPRWDKVLVIDNLLAMVRYDRETFLLTYHRETVEGLRAGIEALANLIPGDFPLKTNTLGPLSEYAKKTCEQLKALAAEK